MLFAPVQNRDYQNTCVLQLLCMPGAVLLFPSRRFCGQLMKNREAENWQEHVDSGLSLLLCASLSLCQTVSVSVSLCVPLCVCVSLSESVCFCVSVCLYLSLSLSDIR